MFRMLQPVLWIAIVLFVSVSPTWAAGESNTPEKECDGEDNDGDGLIDEGFDTDGDGVARCCDGRPFFVIKTTGQNELYAYHNQCSDTFDRAPAPLASLPPGQRLDVTGVADIDGDGQLDVVWTEFETRHRYIATCNGREWVSLFNSSWEYRYHGGADIDLNGVVDFVGWDFQNNPVSGPAQGPGPDLGITTLFGAGTYSELYGSWIPNPLLGQWNLGRTYNAEDLDGDCLPDIVFYGYATGGASDTDLYWAPGNGFGFDPPMFLGSIPNQPQNYGDLGDINCDGCTDWIGGPDDDGDKGAIYAGYGNCTGQLAFTEEPIVDACDGCPGSGPGHGRGVSRLYDWNCDGRLDLLTHHIRETPDTATLLYWPGTCDGFGGPIPVIENGLNRFVLDTPLRN